ncbi:MAG: neprosin family prolyl endopeptidase [Gemmatimonadota bacterium]
MSRRLADSANAGPSGADSARKTAAGPSLLKPLCQEGQVPLIAVDSLKARPGILKGNPLLGPDRLRVSLQPDSLPALGERIRRNLLNFDSVYAPRMKRDTIRRPLPPDPAAACDGTLNGDACYYYGSAAQRRDADGGGMTATVERPAYDNSGGSGHTLNELSVQGGTGDGNIIEIGWNVSTDQYTNGNPHLFVFHWKDWVPTCYDGCGFVQYSGTYFPGQDIAALVGRQVYIGYVFYQGNWWAWFDNQWLGYFPGTEWPNGYSRSALTQWFGEVATRNGVPPKTDMGNGAFPATTSAASMQTLCDVVAADWVCWYRDQQLLIATAVLDDISRIAFGAARYGGPGQ